MPLFAKLVTGKVQRLVVSFLNNFRPQKNPPFHKKRVLTLKNYYKKFF